jgi:hypothetical protein
MTDKQIIIDENICEYYSDTKEDEEGANPIVGWCNDNYCKCEDIPFDECLFKAIQYCKLKDKQLKRKEQECERLEKIVAHCCHDILYKDSLQGQLDQLKAENEELKNFHINLVGVKECEIKELVKYKQALTEIKEIAEKDFSHTCWLTYEKQLRQILQKCEV